MNASWQRCRVHFMRNALAHADKSGRRVVSALIATAFVQEDEGAAKTQWRKVADQLRPTLPKLAAFMDDAECDVLAYASFPKDHWPKIQSTNGIERLNGEIKRRTEVASASSRTRRRSRASSARSCWNKMTNGPSSAAATWPWKRSLL